MNNELEFMIDVVSKASILTKAIQQEKTSMVFTKDDQSPVTVADFASQLFITHYLQERFPDAVLLAEENIIELSRGEKRILDYISGLLSQYIPNYSLERTVAQYAGMPQVENPKRYWVLDPIDGTKGFLRGEQYAIALALIEDGVPVLGVIGCPNLDLDARPAYSGAGIIAYGILGKGAWIKTIDGQDEPIRLSVSSCSDSSKARFVLSAATSHSNNDEFLAIKASLNNKEEVDHFDSQAKYVMIAAGRHDAFIRVPPKQNPGYREKVWDHAAGVLLVHEAGGKVTDIYGKPFDFSQGTTLTQNNGVVVSNNLLHQSIIDFFIK